MTELPCWALVLMACVAVFLAVLIIVVLARSPTGRGSRGPARAAAPAANATANATAGGAANATAGGAAQHVPPDQIQAWIANKPRAAVLFYAPWCKHCHDLLPKYQEVAQRSALPMGMVNCDENAKVVSLYGLRGFPTVMRFVDGQMEHEYEGDRTVASLAAFCA